MSYSCHATGENAGLRKNFAANGPLNSSSALTPALQGNPNEINPGGNPQEYFAANLQGLKDCSGTFGIAVNSPYDVVVLWEGRWVRLPVMPCYRIVPFFPSAGESRKPNVYRKPREKVKRPPTAGRIARAPKAHEYKCLVEGCKRTTVRFCDVVNHLSSGSTPEHRAFFSENLQSLSDAQCDEYKKLRVLSKRLFRESECAVGRAVDEASGLEDNCNRFDAEQSASPDIQVSEKDPWDQILHDLPELAVQPKYMNLLSEPLLKPYEESSDPLLGAITTTAITPEVQFFNHRSLTDNPAFADLKQSADFIRSVPHFINPALFASETHLESLMRSQQKSALEPGEVEAKQESDLKE